MEICGGRKVRIMRSATPRTLAQRVPTHGIRGLVLGTALVLAALSAHPADASSERRGPDRQLPDTVSTPVIVIPTPAPPPPPTFYPDVRVSYLGSAAKGAGREYRFRVTNVGIGGTGSIAMEKTVAQRTLNGEAVTHQTFTAQLGALVTDESATVTVTCQPLGGHVCFGAALKATIGNDLDPSNNMASSH
jgi:hypothetical protein